MLILTSILPLPINRNLSIAYTHTAAVIDWRWCVAKGFPLLSGKQINVMSGNLLYGKHLLFQNSKYKNKDLTPSLKTDQKS